LVSREQRLARAHPGAVLRQHAQRLDDLEGRLRIAGRARLERARSRFTAAQALLQRASPAAHLRALALRLETARLGLARAARGRLADRRQHFELAARALHAVSPLATLDRGYAIVADADGRVLQDVAGLNPGDRVTARLARGRIAADVVSVEPVAATPPERDP
jgi:exodeoxyribonuclease VII large subunit